MLEGVEEFGVGVRAVEGETGVIIRNGTAVVRIVDDDGMVVLPYKVYVYSILSVASHLTAA